MQLQRCCICGTVKNCGEYVDRVMDNMVKIGALFDKYAIILYYDKSHDDTLEQLHKHMSVNPNIAVVYENHEQMSSHRTHNIAKGRNYCMQQISMHYSDYEYFIMMDCDDVCSSKINVNTLRKWLSPNVANEWDALSFRRTPYYDIWALSIGPYLLSCYHFAESYRNELSQYINRVMETTPSNKLIPCYSAFNGFAIYRTSKFINCTYYGRLLFDLVPMKTLKQMVARFGQITTDMYPHEDCEHRRFHFEAIYNNGAKIRISTDQLFEEKLVPNAQAYLDPTRQLRKISEPMITQFNQNSDSTHTSFQIIGGVDDLRMHRPSNHDVPVRNLLKMITT